MDEVAQKLGRLRGLAASKGLDAILLQRVSSLAWITDGAAAYVNTATSSAEATVLVMPDREYLFTNNIEAPRLEKEEGLASLGWDLQVAPWYEPNPKLRALTGSIKLGSDGLYPTALDLSNEIAHLRADLTPKEGVLFRELGKSCAGAMNAAIRRIHPGQTEFEIAARLCDETQKYGVQPIVVLIATDERIYNFRHPLPTSKKLEQYAMLILCGRLHGLVCSITRLIHFGRLPNELRRKSDAVAYIDAGMISSTRPGTSLGKIFQELEDGYSRMGYPCEWQLHHQGGPAGYEPREYVATPDSKEIVKAGQAYAWNPSITGAKSEDTILIGEQSNEVITAIPGWPKVELDNLAVDRPAILVME